MRALRGYIDRVVARISFDRVLPWEIDPEEGFYDPASGRAGF